VGAYALVFLIIVVEDFQLFHPIHHGDKTDNGEHPVNRVGTPPTVCKSKEIVWGKKVVYK
jgi:hypothetical protein